MLPVVRNDPYLALVYIEKLPEIVGFTGKGIAAGVLKIVDGVDLTHFQHPGQGDGFVRHGHHLRLWIW